MRFLFDWLFPQKDWRVVYPEGDRSVPMDAKTARDYAYIFGGRVERVKSESGRG